MERERPFDRNRRMHRYDGPAGGGGGDLNRHREDVDRLLRASDRIFDSINNIQAQQYLEQNLQRGGQ